VFAVAAATAPTGYVLLDGSTITAGQTKYPNLWALIPAGWKSGANIVLPDMRGRTIIGAGTGSGLTARTLATALGTETVTLSSAESGTTAHAHTASSSSSSGTVSADHTHSGSTGGDSTDHAHTTNVSDVVRNANTIGAFVVSAGSPGFNYGPANIGTTGVNVFHTHAFTTGGISANHTHAITTSTTVNAATGAAAASAHNNMQPSYVLNWIMKT
jgi:microcystin-dependent protein